MPKRPSGLDRLADFLEDVYEDVRRIRAEAEQIRESAAPAPALYTQSEVELYLEMLEAGRRTLLARYHPDNPNQKITDGGRRYREVIDLYEKLTATLRSRRL